MVANRDGSHHDHSFAWSYGYQTGFLYAPLPGVKVEVVNREGNPVLRIGRVSVIANRGPAMTRGILWRSEEIQRTVLVADPGSYFTRRRTADEDGYIWVMGASMT